MLHPARSAGRCRTGRAQAADDWLRRAAARCSPYPIFAALGSAQRSGHAFALVMAALVIVSGYTSINAVVKAEMFPAHIRALGVALPYALANTIFGGTAEYVALWLKKLGHEPWFYIYISLLCAIVARRVPEDARDQDDQPDRGGLMNARAAANRRCSAASTSSLFVFALIVPGARHVRPHLRRWRRQLAYRRGAVDDLITECRSRIPSHSRAGRPWVATNGCPKS